MKNKKTLKEIQETLAGCIDQIEEILQKEREKK